MSSQGERESETETETESALVIEVLIHHEDPTLMTSSKPAYRPKAPPPNTLTLGVRASTYEFGGTPTYEFGGTPTFEFGGMPTFSPGQSL